MEDVLPGWVGRGGGRHRRSVQMCGVRSAGLWADVRRTPRPHVGETSSSGPTRIGRPWICVRTLGGNPRRLRIHADILHSGVGEATALASSSSHAASPEPLDAAQSPALRAAGRTAFVEPPGMMRKQPWFAQSGTVAPSPSPQPRIHPISLYQKGCYCAITKGDEAAEWFSNYFGKTSHEAAAQLVDAGDRAADARIMSADKY
ncbi:hypothetical protein E2562_022587 [Oryza meyeriana var. granulata]|uniref:Uncharacterized protein n=1 Tax=Oryza meyeriana var. granulata TaxID=110450 RepID=A0A6G1CS24_9ORYZ|nr:hypothetical protein E2562_022587 [Oryza meyeriana var. granulata]